MQSRCKKYIQHAVRIIAGCFLICIMKETGVGNGIINGRVFAEKGKQEIADGAVRMMLPALVYAAEKDQTDTPSKDLAWAVMRWLWPAGAFMTEQGKEETAGEDSRTYAMILEKQENDENAVDKNGKLITQNPDTEEKETWKTPVVKADISMEKLRDYEYLMSHFYTVDSSTMADVQPGEKITAMIPIKEYNDDHYLFMATRKGIVKKTPITDYANIRKNGLAAINLREDDKLIEVKVTDNTEEVFLFTKFGQCIRFKETDVRSTGRTTMGVIGMNLAPDDVVIAMQLASQGDSVMIVSENGLGKCTLIDEFTAQNRGGKGVKCYKITEKSGNLVGVKSVSKDDEIMLITTEGIIIRMQVNDTTLLGRVTTGVKLINLGDGIKVASIAKVVEDKSLIPQEEDNTEE